MTSVNSASEFWGVRGSIPCPGPATLRYGGNTACVEVRCGERLIIFDGGTGLRELGDALMRTAGRSMPTFCSRIAIVDHVGGFPFFTPFYRRRPPLPAVGGKSAARFGCKDAIEQHDEPSRCFRSGSTRSRPTIEYRDFRAGETLKPAAASPYAPRRSIIRAAPPATGSIMAAVRSPT